MKNRSNGNEIRIALRDLKLPNLIRRDIKLGKVSQISQPGGESCDTRTEGNFNDEDLRERSPINEKGKADKVALQTP